jgi:hypothetical protein
MSNPNNAIWWAVGIICAWPLLTFFLGILLATAFQRGWFIFRIDPSRAPRFARRHLNER